MNRPERTQDSQNPGWLSRLTSIFQQDANSAAETNGSPSCENFEDWMLRTYMLVEPHRIIYCPIEKNACTYFKTLMLQHSDVAQEFADSDLKSHTFINQRRKPLLNDPKIMKDDSYFKFVVVREPVERIVSAYLNKFVLNRNFRWAVDAAKKYARLDHAFEGNAEQLTFRQFVRVLVEHSDNDLDVHWRPQSAFCQPVIDCFDHVVPMEKLTEFLPILEERLQTSISPEKTHNRNRYQSYASDEPDKLPCDIAPHELRQLEQYPDVQSLVTNELAEQLANRYQQDAQLYRRAIEHWSSS